MKTLVKIIVGVFVAILTFIVLKHFGCSDFTQGLWAGTFGCLAQSVTGDIQKMK